jgi:hypothetical protein
VPAHAAVPRVGGHARRKQRIAVFVGVAGVVQAQPEEFLARIAIEPQCRIVDGNAAQGFLVEDGGGGRIAVKLLHQVVAGYG